MIRWLVLLAACSPRVVAPTTPIPIAIVAQPERTLPSCWISEMPEPPELLTLQFDDEDIMRRTSVHMIDGNAIIQYERDLHAWSKEVRTCLFLLMGQEP